MRRLGLLLAMLMTGTIALVLAPVPAYACSCVQRTTADALRDADTVFRGRVIVNDKASTRSPGRTDLRFEVDGVYKGTAYRDQLVSSADNSAACGFTPDVGSSWIVFTRQSVDGTGDQAVDRLVTGLCSGNVPSSKPPAVLGRSQPPIDGASDRTEKVTQADRRLNRGLAYAGIGVLFVGALATAGLVWLWRPGRRRP